MPILLEEDRSLKLPKMYRVRQQFPNKQLEQIEETVKQQIHRQEIKAKVKPRQRVAVAVGSRGIKNLSRIVKQTVDSLKELGAEPFIVSAMGSHGNGTEEGQREVLAGYGITKEALGVPVVTTVDCVELGQTKKGVKVFFDRSASQADLIVPINRVKLHTDFLGNLQSGLCKMLVIGLGNHIGCSTIHDESFDIFAELIEEAASLIIEKTKVGFGIAILENAYDQTTMIEAIPAEQMIAREKELVKISLDFMPTLMIPDIDVLVVQKIGKDVSGAGFDPNILGRSSARSTFVLKIPKIGRMVLLDVTEESHGNGIGVGLFDVITKNVFEELDLEAMYANAVACKCIDDVKIPLMVDTEDEAIRVAIKTLRNVDKEHLKIVRIKNTLELGSIEVSEALLGCIKENDRLLLESNG